MLGQYTRVLQGPEGNDDDDRVTAVRIEERHKSRVLSAMILVLPICFGAVAAPRSFGWDRLLLHSWTVRRESVDADQCQSPRSDFGSRRASSSSSAVCDVLR